MRTFLALLLLFAAALPPAQARKPKILDPTMVPKSDATIDALSAVIAGSKDRQARLGLRVTALRNQIAAIKARAKNAKIDVAEQLSKEDLDAFNLLNTQLRYLQAEMTVEEYRQRNLEIARDIYRASYFDATMMTEYIGEKGAIDDDFDDFCRARAQAYGMALPIGMLLSVQDYIMDTAPAGK